MIQKGIIAQVIDKYNYKVRIPKYDKIASATYSTKTEDLASGIVCTIPGIDISYSVNDVVLVSFENDEISKPIILGLLYRDHSSDSDISISNVDSSLGDIKDNLNELNSSQIFTHLKYSNDNGLTFTSLFSKKYYEVQEDGEIFCKPYFDEDQKIKGIEIDKTARVINWSIIDDNNTDITSTIPIETILFDSEGNILNKTEKEDKLSNITINNSSQLEGSLYITYKLYITKEYLDTLHVSLTTDKEVLGSVQGDYLGIYSSNSPVPSLIPSDYHWVSFNKSIQEYLYELKVDLNTKILNLREEIEENLVEIYYKSVNWSQEEVDTYCNPGYEDNWSRDPDNGYMGDVAEGNVLYITVHNTGENLDSVEDDSYGRLEIRALEDALYGQPVHGIVKYYDISGELSVNALARFKSSLLAANNQTLIYGGHITTGYIQDSTGRNFIQLSTESDDRISGCIEFKTSDDWETANNGLQWKITRTYDGGTDPKTGEPTYHDEGALNIKGNIFANSLTIIPTNPETGEPTGEADYSLIDKLNKEITDRQNESLTSSEYGYNRISVNDSGIIVYGVDPREQDINNISTLHLTGSSIIFNRKNEKVASIESYTKDDKGSSLNINRAIVATLKFESNAVGRPGRLAWVSQSNLHLTLKEI